MLASAPINPEKPATIKISSQSGRIDPFLLRPINRQNRYPRNQIQKKINARKHPFANAFITILNILDTSSNA